jgi:hypothetical protein
MLKKKATHFFINCRKRWVAHKKTPGRLSLPRVKDSYQSKVKTAIKQV